MRLLFALVLLLAQSAHAVEQMQFHLLVPAAPNQIVIMYSSGSAESDQAFQVVEEVENLIKQSGVAGTENLAWRACDANYANNRAELELKGLLNLPMIFVSVEGQGMDRYMREVSVEKLSEFILTKYESTTDEDVFPYNEELISDAYPVFVKFHEQWCSRCLAMKKAFENTATRMVGRVMFMEVECSSSETAQKFCLRHLVDGYPTLKLMGGNFSQAITFHGDRSVQGFLEFLNQHVPEALLADEDLPPAPASDEPKTEL